jgi:hypothetical protein
MAGKKRGDVGQPAEAEAQGQQAAQQQTGERRPPAHEVQLGRVKAVVWENHSDAHGRWFSITCGRSYKDNSGNWRTAQSFGRDDLLVLAECLRQCYLWVADAMLDAGNGTNSNGNGGTRGQQGSADIPF